MLASILDNTSESDQGVRTSALDECVDSMDEIPKDKNWKEFLGANCKVGLAVMEALQRRRKEGLERGDLNEARKAFDYLFGDYRYKEGSVALLYHALWPDEAREEDIS